MIRTSPLLRPAALLAAGSVALLGLAACSSASSSPAAAPAASVPAASGTASAQVDVADVTLHIGDQAGSGSQALLTAAGLINKLPFHVAWSDFTSGPPMLQAMSAGDIDVGGVGDAPPVFSAAAGGQIDIVQAINESEDAYALLVPKGSAITSVSDLRGKRIAVVQGSAGDYHILTVLNKAGIPVKDVTLVYLTPAEALAAFTSGHVDAWDIWAPFLEEAEQLDGARALVTGPGYGSPYSFTVASKAALADPAKAAAIRDYLALIAQAHVWANVHQSTWASVWGKAAGLPDAVMLAAAKDSYEVAVPITPAIVASEQQVSNAFTTAGLIPTQVNFANYFDTSLGAS